MSPSVLMVVLLLMATFRVGAMESFAHAEETKSPAVRPESNEAHSRNSSCCDHDEPDNMEAMNIGTFPEITPPGIPPNSHTDPTQQPQGHILSIDVGPDHGHLHQIPIPFGGGTLSQLPKQNQDPRAATTQRVAMMALALLQRAKNLAISDDNNIQESIREWEESKDPEARDAIINEKIYPSNAHSIFNRADCEQRHKVAALLRRVHEMQQNSPGRMEEAPSDMAKEGVDPMLFTQIVQVPSARERITPMDALKNVNKDHKQAVGDLTRLTEVVKTMASISLVDYFTLSQNTLSAVNASQYQGMDAGKSLLILNDSVPPKSFLIADPKSRLNARSIVPMIIPSPVFSDNREVAANREPTVEENREVRRLLDQAFSSQFGVSFRSIAPNFTRSPEPLNVISVQNMMAAIEEDYPDKTSTAVVSTLSTEVALTLYKLAPSIEPVAAYLKQSKSHEVEERDARVLSLIKDSGLSGPLMLLRQTQDEAKHIETLRLLNRSSLSDALMLLQKNQEIDLEQLGILRDVRGKVNVLEDSPDEIPARSSSAFSALAQEEEKKGNTLGVISENFSFPSLLDNLITQQEIRMQHRNTLLTNLSELITKQKWAEQKWFHSTEFRIRQPRGL